MDKASKNFVVPPTELEVKTAVAEEIRKWRNFRLQQVATSLFICSFLIYC